MVLVSAMGPSPLILSESIASLQSNYSACSVLETDLSVAAGGVPAHALHIGDLRTNPSIRAVLGKVPLREYFDRRGLPRLQRLGFSFAAKQNEATKHSFGSRVKTEPAKEGSKGPKKVSAREAHLASKALEKEANHRQMQLGELFGGISLAKANKIGQEVVSKRQLEMFFQDLPDFERLIPDEVEHFDLLPVSFTREDELRERKVAERMVANFSDPVWMEGSRMGWLFDREEVKDVVSLVGLWAKAARGANCSLGMDRSCFSRFILDAGLVDQHKSPHFWAVSLFDSMSQPVRCCPTTATWAPSAPIAVVVNRWVLVSIIDTMVRQHYTEHTKQKFLHDLTKVARRRFPKEFCDLGKHSFRTYLASEGLGHLRFLQCSDTAAGMSPLARHMGNGFGLEGDSDSGGESGDEDQDHLDVDYSDAAASRAEAVVAKARQDAKMKAYLANAMLVEPEVMYMMLRHWDLFSKLHSCYADDSGHLSLQCLMSLCHDVGLMPEMVTAHLLTSTYESAKSLVYEAGRAPRGSCVFGDADTGADSPHAALSGERTPHASVLLKSVPEFSISGPRNVEPATQSTPVSAAGFLRRGAGLGTLAGGAAGEFAGFAGKAPTFGVSALLETICRCVFMFLGSYGNAVQQSSTAYARVIWLLVFLRSSIEKRVEAAGLDQPVGISDSLKRFLDLVTPDLWQAPFCHKTLGVPTLLPKNVHPMPGSAARKVDRDFTRRTRENLLGHVMMAPSLYTTREKNMGNFTAMACAKKFGKDAEERRQRMALRDAEEKQEKRPRHKTLDASTLPGRGTVVASTSLSHRGTIVGSVAPRAHTGPLPTKARRPKLSTIGAMDFPTGVSPRAPDSTRSTLPSRSGSAVPLDLQRGSSDSAEPFPMHRQVSTEGAPDPTGRSAVGRVAADLQKAADESSDESDDGGGSRAASALQGRATVFLPTVVAHVSMRQPKPPTPREAAKRPLPSGPGPAELAGAADPMSIDELMEEDEEEVMRVEELFPKEAGKPAILDDVCMVCRKPAEDRKRWGNPRCRGCSIVDALPFDSHPFRLLLQTGPSQPSSGTKRRGTSRASTLMSRLPRSMTYDSNSSAA